MAITTGGYKGFGTKLSIKISASFTLIGNVISVEGPDPTVGMRETTNLASTARAYRPTLPDYGKAKFTVQYDPDDTTTHSVLDGKITSPPTSPDEFKLEFPTTDTTLPNVDFKGFITGSKLKGMDTKNDTITKEYEIQITDTFTATAGTP